MKKLIAIFILAAFGASLAAVTPAGEAKAVRNGSAAVRAMAMLAWPYQPKMSVGGA